MYLSKKDLEKFKDILSNGQKFLILGHQRPDGDCAGSVLAWFNFLKGESKAVQAYLSDQDARLDFLNNYYEAEFDYHNLNFDELDCIITCDFNDLERSGIAHLIKQNKLNNKSVRLINIDHHVGKADWADLTFSVENASSTTVIIYELFKQLNLKMNKVVATCLLTGLLTDTSFLSNKATNDEAFLIYKNLLDLGADEKSIIKNQQSLSLNIIKALGEILAEIVFRPEWGLAIARISENLLAKYHLQESDLDLLYNLLIKIKEYKVILVLKDRENGELIKGSWRTREEINVGKLAKFMGGGGHEKAAGFAVQHYKI